MNRMNKIELIVPAGNEECLKAAVENGADAVYFGLKEFNARRRADNFSLDEIRRIIDYCHRKGVRAYCTMNILVKNQELTRFFALLKTLYLAGIDAVIIQHLSFLPIIKQNFPGMEVHISTQAAVSNSYYGELVKLADKVVLPREFSRQEIRDFITKTKLNTEIFVQGALCFSYSGKCLFSSAIGGRSGNRGLCAQPCRRRYNGKYLLSMKDLCLVEKIPEIVELGVKALKIEGRLRSAKYAAAATKLYRTAIDSYYSGNFRIDEELVKEMELSFNREFTKGYFGSEKNLISPEKPMGRGLYLGIINGGKIVLNESLSVGDGVGIWLKERVDGAVIKKMEKDGKPIKEANKGEIVRLFIRADDGTKIYKTSSVKKPVPIQFIRNEEIKLPERKVGKIALPEMKIPIAASGGASSPIVGIFKVADTPLRTSSTLSHPSQATGYPQQIKRQKGNFELWVKVYSKRDADFALNALNQADKALKQASNTLNHAGKTIYKVKVFYNLFAGDYEAKYGAYVPRLLTDAEVEKAMEIIKEKKVKEVLTGNLGVYTLLKSAMLKNYLPPGFVKIYLDYDANLFNDYDLQYFGGGIVSPELGKEDLNKFQNRDFAVLAHGRLVLMNTLYAGLPEKLTDEKGYTFPVRKEHKYYQILNSRELGLFEEVLWLKEKGLKVFLDLEDIGLLKVYREILEGRKTGISKKRKKGYTKGHWERGVE